MTMPLERIKIVTEIVTAWVGLIALVAGGIFAIVQYLDKEQGDRVKASLDLLIRYNDKHVVEARLRLTDVWAREEDALETLVRKPAVAISEINSFVITTIKVDGLHTSIDTMVDFYDLVEVCIEKKLCDRTAARALFARSAKSFFMLHYPFLAQLRTNRNDQSYAMPLQELAVAKY